MAMNKTIEDINIYTWFVDRNVNPCPEHFVKSRTELTEDSKLWIHERLIGRFSINHSGLFMGQIPAFEDPKEAMMYELTWG
jgi:hypothetical protein